MPKYKLRIVRFPYGGSEASECVDWLVRTAVTLAADQRFEASQQRINDTPITMTRNRVFRQAVEEGIDFLLIVDSDMFPDVELGTISDAKPFLQTSIEFALAHAGPCAIAAPYCGPPPHENVYVFMWTDMETGHPNRDAQLVQFSREQAATMTGITEVAALPTGLMLIDVRAFAVLPADKPYTYYEWTDGWERDKASTEDVTFTRDLSLAGVPVYCNWDAWAGHIKRKVVRKPRPFTADMVAAKLHDAVLKRRDRNDRAREISPSERIAADIAAAEAAYAKEKATGFSGIIVDAPHPSFSAASIEIPVYQPSVPPQFSATSARPQAVVAPMTEADLFDLSHIP